MFLEERKIRIETKRGCAEDELDRLCDDLDSVLRDELAALKQRIERRMGDYVIVTVDDGFGL